MKVAIVFFQLCLLFAIYQVGNYIQQLLHIPIPGSIIGMLLLFILLQLKVVKVKWIANGANFLLSYLTLLFIPATVGIIQYVGFFSGMGILSIVVVIISTIIVMLSSGYLAQKVAIHQEQKVGAKQTGKSHTEDRGA